MGSISSHITPIVINSLLGGHTHTNTHKKLPMSVQKQFKKTGALACSRRSPGSKKSFIKETGIKSEKVSKLGIRNRLKIQLKGCYGMEIYSKAFAIPNLTAKLSTIN